MDNHYKFRKGRISLERVVNAMDGINMIDSVRRGIIEYFVEGKTVKETKVNSSLLMPYLREVNTNITIDNLYVRKFLYTDEFSPRGKQNVSNRSLFTS